MTKVNVTFHGMEGEGKNVTEAKREAGRKIEKVLKADYTPTIVAWGGVGYIIWQSPTPYGVSVRSRKFMERGVVKNGSDCHGTYYGKDDIRQIESSIMLSIAQETWDGESEEHELLRLRPDLAKEFSSWAKFQKRHQTAKRLGMSDDECHCFAGGMLHLLRGAKELTDAAREELKRSAS